jgi:hypothetical protein
MVSVVAGGAAQGAPEQLPAGRRVRDVLGTLFPAPVRPGPRSLGWRVAAVALQVTAVALGTWLLLLRIPGVPPWDSLYFDDFGTFYTRALNDPWQLFTPAHGYVQVIPHVAAQLAPYVPLNQVPVVFAVFGTLTASACALYVFHASAGHIRSVWLRAVLGMAVVLLPIAPLEIADNTLGTPWYMILALFWAVLWRPRTGAGMAVTAILAFAAAASTSVGLLYAPLLAMRLYVLRRPRDHAVTAGWLAGCLAQIPAIVWTYDGGHSPLNKPSLTGRSPSFYAHDDVLPSLGWHLSWWLQSFAGRNGATVIVAVALAVAFAAILITQPQNRLFVVTALAFGFGVTMFLTALLGYPSTSPPVMPDFEWGSRYTALPIFLIEAAIIVGADGALRQWGRKRSHATIATRDERQRAKSAGRTAGAARPASALVTGTVATALIAVIVGSWVPDFRYPNAARARYATGQWETVVTQWHLDCAISWSRVITVRVMPAVTPQTIPCSRLRF